MTRKELILIFSCFVTILAVTSYFAHLDPDWHHDGIIFKPAVDVASGQVLYRDTFSQYGFFTTYLQSAAITLFGKHLIVLRLHAALFLSLSGVLIFILAKSISSTSIAGLCVLVWLALAPYIGGTLLPWSSIYSMFFVLLGGYLILVVFSGKPRRGSRYLLCYLSGLSLALGFWVRQPVGLMLPVMFLAFGLLYLDRDIVNRRLVVGAFAYIGGMLSVSALIIAFLWYTNSLGDWWLQSIVGASRFPSGILNSGESFLENLYHRAFPSPNLIRGISSGSLWALLPVLNLAVFIVLLIRLSIFRSQSIESRNLFILSLLAAGMWHHYFPVPGAWQIYWGATPMIAVVITAFFRLAILLKLSTQVSTLVVLIITLSIFGSEIERRLTPIVDSKPLHPISIPTLEGMWASSRFATKVRFDGSPSEFEDELTKLGNVLRNLATLDPARPLVTLTEDLFLASTLNELNPGPVTVWWDWVRSLYPNHKKEFRDFVREHAPIVEAKIKPWAGLDPINDSNLRVTLGIDSYEPLITTTYSDSGPAVLLLPPDLLRQYKMTYGISQILSAN